MSVAAASNAGGAIIGLLFWLAIYAGIITACVKGARNRGRRPTLWGWLGFVFGLFALIALYIMPNLANQTKQIEATAVPNADLDRLARLHELRRQGALSEEDFEYQKLLVLEGNS